MGSLIRFQGLFLCALFGFAFCGSGLTLSACKDTEFFDNAALGCSVCPKDLEPDFSFKDSLGNALSCRCPIGTIISWPECNSKTPLACDSPECTSCTASGKASTSDSSLCVSCGTNTTGTPVAKTGDCECSSSSQVLIEKNVLGEFLDAKICSTCPPRSRVFTTDTGLFKADPYACQMCSSEHMTPEKDGSCSCDSDYVETGVEGIGDVSCISSAQSTTITAEYAVSAATGLTFYDVATSSGSKTTVSGVSSLTYRHYYLKAATDCYHYQSSRDIAACQTLANLCALEMYNPSSKVCALLTKIQTARGSLVHGWVGWANTLPFVEYKTQTSSVLSATDLKMQMAFNSDNNPGTYDELYFKLFKYSINGTFLGVEALNSQFYYCLETAMMVTGNATYLKFGRSETHKFKCDLRSLIPDAGTVSSPVLYDLYIVDPANKDSLYPVPVRIVNYRSSTGSHPNDAGEPGGLNNDVLVRRFALLDAFSGLESLSSQPRVIRYAKLIQLEVEVDRNSPSQLLTPVLTLQYEEAQPSVVSTSESVAIPTLTFKMSYTMNTDGFWNSINAMFVILLIGVALGTLLRSYNYSRRNSRSAEDSGINLETLLRFAAHAGNVFAVGGFWFLVLCTFYWYIFFKLQAQVFALFPLGNDGEYDSFHTMATLVFIGACIRVAEILYTQCNVDIFLVDWEKPKEVLDADHRPRNSSVSAWRSIFMANEWAELQTARRTCLPFTLIVMAFLMEGWSLKNFATPQPDGGDLGDGERNVILQFANGCFWFMFLSILQMVWKWLFYERYISEPPTDRFVDLCTMAKISMLILDEKHHGYYLHCKSPHAFADGNMMDMANDLKQEADGLSVSRGLSDTPGPNGEDVQTFELLLTQEWRARYDFVYKSVLDRELQGLQNAQEVGRLGALRTANQRRTAFTAPPEALLKAQQKLNNFVKNFVDQSDEQHRRDWGARTLPMKLLNVPPETQMISKSLFFVDLARRYSKVLFWGVEWELLLFNVMTFCMVQMWSDSVTAAALLTYFADEAVSAVRSHYGNDNVSKKSLVHHRFLI